MQQTGSETGVFCFSIRQEEAGMVGLKAISE